MTWTKGLVGLMVGAGCLTLAACSSHSTTDAGGDVGNDGSVLDVVAADRADTGTVVDTGPGTDTGPTDTGPGTDTGPADTGPADAASLCGNGTVDTGETCDTAITTGTGACPTSCDDGMVCTADSLDGTACTAACTHTPITTAMSGDGCCPTGATSITDSDCHVACGNGVVETGETCDTAITSGTGSCPTAASCNDSVACTADALAGSACTAMCTHTTITTAMSGDGCCPSGATHATDTDCPASCGDGIVETGETCDTAIASGTGSCPTAASCNDTMACTTDSLVSGGTCNAACTHSPITAPINSDGCCPPGATAATDNDCTATCGNGVIEGTEQCDDGPGPLRNLDGCDTTCHYEMITRMTNLTISGSAAPAAMGCTPATNRLGSQVFSGTALSQLNPQLATSITSGSTNVLLDWLGVVDLTGANDPGISLGVLDAIPDPAKGGWPMAGNPIDWWFQVDHITVNSMGLPTSLLMPASITTRNLVAGPGNVTLTLLLGGSPASLAMLATRVRATVNGTPAPNVPSPPPSALASGLTVFQTVTGNGAGQGLCGNVTVASLAQIPIPAALAAGGSTACGSCTGSHTYTPCAAGQTPGTSSCNSLLDVMVGGCKVVACLVAVATSTQPDVPAGTAVRTLTLGTGNKVPAAQTTGNTDAYSLYTTFTANRAHATGETCVITADCQSGLTCTTGVCR